MVGLQLTPSASKLLASFCLNDALDEAEDARDLEDMARALRLARCFRREVAELPAAPRLLLHEARPLGFNASALSSEWFRPQPRFTKPSAWVRLYLDLYLPEVPRVVYLDTDTIVRSNIAPLYRMRMQHAVAASWDNPAPYNECVRKHPQLHGADRSWSFNSGVLLFDLRKWRAGGFAQVTERWIHDLGGCYGDQLSMNLGLQGKVDWLPWSWHVKWFGTRWAAMLQMPCFDHANILHFSGPDASIKPWLRSRNAVLDFLVEPYTPRQQCEALPDDLAPLYRGRGAPPAHSMQLPADPVDEENSSRAAGKRCETPFLAWA